MLIRHKTCSVLLNPELILKLVGTDLDLNLDLVLEEVICPEQHLQLLHAVFLPDQTHRLIRDSNNTTDLPHPIPMEVANAPELNLLVLLQIVDLVKDIIVTILQEMLGVPSRQLHSESKRGQAVLT